MLRGKNRSKKQILAYSTILSALVERHYKLHCNRPANSQDSAVCLTIFYILSQPNDKPPNPMVS